MPITDQSSRTLVNRWAVSLDKRGEALPALKETEYSEMLILAAKTPGLLEAIKYAETKCVTNLPLGTRICGPVCKGKPSAITLQFATMTTCVKGVCQIRFGDTASAPVHSQCPRELQPLFKSIAKNYPVSGMLAPGYAARGFKALLRSNTRELNLVEKRRLAEGFPALHEVAARSAWTCIPEELMPLLHLLRRKAQAAGSCMEVLNGEVPRFEFLQSLHICQMSGKMQMPMISMP